MSFAVELFEDFGGKATVDPPNISRIGNSRTISCNYGGLVFKNPSIIETLYPKCAVTYLGAQRAQVGFRRDSLLQGIIAGTWSEFIVTLHKHLESFAILILSVRNGIISHRNSFLTRCYAEAACEFATDYCLPN